MNGSKWRLSGNLQLPLHQRLDIFKVHFSFWILQVECLYGIYIAEVVQLRERLLTIFSYSRVACSFHISLKNLIYFLIFFPFLTAHEIEQMFNLCNKYSTYRLWILIWLRGGPDIGLDETRTAPL
jgi:hypothetical protein